MIICGSGWVLTMVAVRSHYDWHIFVLSSDSVDSVEAGQGRSRLSLSEEVLVSTTN